MPNLKVFIGYGIFCFLFGIGRLNIAQKVKGAGYEIVAQPVVAQKKLLFIVKQTAVIADHYAVLGVPIIDGVNQPLQVFPHVMPFGITASSPLKFVRLSAQGMDGAGPIGVFHGLFCGQQAAGFGIKKEKAAIEKLNRTFKYLPALLLRIRFTRSSGVENKAVAEILHDFIDLVEKRRFNLAFQNVFRFFPFQVKGTGVDAYLLFKKVLFLIIRQFRNKGFSMKEVLEQCVFPLIMVTQGGTKIQFHIVLIGFGAFG